MIAFTTLAGAGFIPKPFTFAGLPVTDTRTMTRTASTTNTVPKTAAVMAVERFGASLADPRREPGPPALLPGGGPCLIASRKPAPPSAHVGRRSGVFDRSCLLLGQAITGPFGRGLVGPVAYGRGRSLLRGWLHSSVGWPRRGGRLPLCAIAACSPRWYRDWRGKQDVASRARMLLPSRTERRSGRGATGTRRVLTLLRLGHAWSVIGALVVELHFPACRSLKEKRAVLRPVIEGARSRFRGCSRRDGLPGAAPALVVEVAAAAASERVVVETLDAVERFIWSRPGLEVVGATRRWLDED